MKRPSTGFLGAIAAVIIFCWVYPLGVHVGQTLEREARGDTMTVVQVEAWCAYANLNDYKREGATPQQLQAAVPEILKFCSQSINQFRALWLEEEGGK